MKSPDDISDFYDAEDNSRKSYDLAISVMREKLESFRREKIGDCTLWLGDCTKAMPLIRAESVDVIWTDPPYGHSNHDGDWNARLNDHRGIEQKPIANDDADGMREVVDLMLREAARVLKRDCCCCCCCCCCGGGPRPTFAWVADRMDRDGLSFFHSVIWDKKNPGLGWRYRRQHEMVMIAHRTGGKLAWADESVAARNIYEGMPPRDRQHPNEKPLDMVKHFLGLHSKPGDMIMDPFMGSGTTGVAAALMGRKFIGIELDPTHFETACRRIEDAYRQSDMFVSEPFTPPPIQISLLEPEPMTSKEKAAQQQALAVDGSRIIAEAKKREEQETEALRQSVIEAAAPRNVDAREEWERLRKLDQAVDDIRKMTKGLRYVRRGRVESVSLVARPGVGRQLAAEVASVMDRPIDLGAPDPETPEYVPQAIRPAPVVEKKRRRKA